MKSLGKTSSTCLFVAIDGYSESLAVHVNLHAPATFRANMIRIAWLRSGVMLSQETRPSFSDDYLRSFY